MRVVEVAARAGFDRANNQWTLAARDHHWGFAGVRDRWIEAVRASMAAMTNPTEEMLAHGAHALIDQELDGPDGVGHLEARACYLAVLGALRNEKE